MNRNCILAAAILFAGLLQAGECVWTGGSGTWSDPANWQDGIVPGAGTDSVRFANTSEITVTLSANVRVLNVTFGTAKVTIPDDKILYVQGTNAFVSVPEGGTAWIGQLQGYGTPAFAKTGAGTLRMTKNCSGYSSFEVAAGRLEVATGPDAFCPCSLVTVKDGAVIETMTENQTNNSLVFWLESGAEFVSGNSDYIGGIFGEAGALCRSSSTRTESCWTIPAGPWTTAVTYSNILITVRGALTTDSAEDQAKRSFVIASGEAFKFARLNYVGKSDSSVYAPDAVKFAPGIRDFRFGSLYATRQGTWTLADTDGEMIDLQAAFVNDFTTPLAGTGLLHVLAKGAWDGSSDKVNTLSLAALDDFAGEIRCGATVTFSGSTAGTVLPKVTCLTKTANTLECYFSVSKPVTFSPPIVGSGWTFRCASGLVTFSDLQNNGLQSMLPYGGSGFVYAGDTRVTVKSDANWMSGKAARQRVEGNASVAFNGLRMRLNADKGELHTAEVAENGTLKVGSLSWLATDDTMAKTRLRIHGGTLAWNGTGSISENNPYHTVTFTNKPVRIDTVYNDDPASSVTLSALLRRETDDTSAQGFVKGGTGRLKVTTAQTELTGPVTVKAGMLVSGTAAAGAIFPGDVTLSNATYAIEAGKGVEKTVSPNGVLNYAGLSELRVIGTPVAGDAITVGKAGSASSALVPSGDGAMLAIRSEAAATTVGTAFAVKVNGGVPTGASGVTVQPIVSFKPETGKTYVRADLLTYDNAVGFKPATTVALANAGATDAAVVSAATTLSADKTVGAVVVDKTTLTISSGKTLTVGDGTNPALVLVNENGDATSLAYGTLAFGGSRGHIVLCGTGFCRMSTTLSGSNGIVYAGPGTTTATFFLDSGTGNYTGGTWIENVQVYAWQYDATPFGAENSDVWIVGNEAGGGQFIFHNSYSANITRKYKWHISGYGVGRSGAINQSNAAARQIEGTLEVVDEAMISVKDGSILNMNATVCGKGKLVRRGYGRLNLNAAANPDWSGGLQIEDGTVRVTKAEQLGTGEIHVAAGGTLVFENAADITVTNKVSGFGLIDVRGTGRVTFTNAKSFVGSQATAGGQLMSATAGSTDVSCYAGTITGAGTSYVKEGAGTQILATTNDYGGATTVSSGTLKLGSAAAKSYAETVIGGSFCHLDASVAGTVVEKSGTTTHEVRTWKDVKDRYQFTQADEASHADWEFPLARDAATGLNGKPSVFFTGFKNRLKETNGDIKFRTMLLAHRAPSGTHPKGWGNAGVIGASGSDNGLRLAGGTSWTGEHGYYYVNGEETRTFANDVAIVSTIVTPSEYDIKKAVVGDYYGHSSINRCYWGDMGELMLFSTKLSASDRKAVERYLMEKWGAVVAEPVTNNVLPATTALEVKKGATLDLNGCDQTVAELSGWGAIVNSGTRTVTLTVTSRYAYKGALPANVKLVLAPGGDAVGTLSVETDLPAATVLCDFGGLTADKVVCTGEANLADAGLLLRPFARFDGDRVEILAAASVVGKFASVSGPADRVLVRYTDTAATLSVRHGLMLIVR